MDKIDNIQQYVIYADAIPVPDVPGCWQFLHDNGKRFFFPEFDLHLPIFLKRSYEVHEYVQIDKEEEVMPIQRQEVNPFFIEFGFFNTIEKNKVNHGSELTNAMLNFIRLRRPDISTMTDNQIKTWFDEIGINEFPWNKGTPEETTLDDIDEASYLVSDIVSKAKFVGIDIYK